MATNILLLPERSLGLQISVDTGQDGEWYDVFGWTQQQTAGTAPNTVTTTVPIDLTGIAFTLTLRPAGGGSVALTLSTAAGTIINTRASLAFNGSLGMMAAQAAGAYTGHIHAVADGHTRMVGTVSQNHTAAV